MNIKKIMLMYSLLFIYLFINESLRKNNKKLNTFINKNQILI